MTFWRPQRAAIRSDESGYYDWGNLNYGVTVGNIQATCAGLFSNVSGGATVIGPLLLGLSKSVQIAPLSASVSRVLQMATLAAYEQDAIEAQA